ncbi:MAG: hypothetical protein LBV17_05175 [Treponema sp.]|jgi:prophage maintenance system killer protein|nr:hypothetical protein [Treponema sp.]
MAFTDELESKIQATYFAILKKKNLTGTGGKTLNTGSLLKIVEEIKYVILKEQNNGSDVMEITNNIIFKILNAKYFVYENHQMAALIGYMYLKRQGVTIKNYSLNGISNNSTLDEIRALTMSW